MPVLIHPGLQDNQEIIYYTVNGHIFSRLMPGKGSGLDILIAQYIRNDQPFIEPGHLLSIPIGRDQIVRTQAVQTVTREGNSLVFETKEGQYRIEYRGIDIESMLKNGAYDGVNSIFSSKEEVIPFPLP